MLTQVETEAANLGFHINAKTKGLSFNMQPAPEIKTISGDSLDIVEDFKYLGSYIENAEKDVNIRKGQAWHALNKLHKIWKSQLFSEVKVHLFVAVV
jgi:hypothetical protein